jgi:hypothetical protein
MMSAPSHIKILQWNTGKLLNNHHGTEHELHHILTSQHIHVTLLQEANPSYRPPTDYKIISNNETKMHEQSIFETQPSPKKIR